MGAHVAYPAARRCDGCDGMRWTIYPKLEVEVLTKYFIYLNCPEIWNTVGSSFVEDP